jgi:DNA topoisomerase-2
MFSLVVITSGFADPLASLARHLASQYLEDDGKKIEPAFFVPVVPMVLVNGTEGIGTGFSSFVPPYNPEDITANIRRVLSGESMTPMTPWFRGFKGTVKKGGDHEWITGKSKRAVSTRAARGRLGRSPRVE